MLAGAHSETIPEPIRFRGRSLRTPATRISFPWGGIAHAFQCDGSQQQFSGNAHDFSPSAGNGLISGSIAPGSGNFLVTMDGTGTWTLNGTNTYTGGTTINNGVLQFTQTNAMPSSGTVTVNNGATLAVNAGGAGEFTRRHSGAARLAACWPASAARGARHLERGRDPRHRYDQRQRRSDLFRRHR